MQIFVKTLTVKTINRIGPIGRHTAAAAVRGTPHTVAHQWTSPPCALACKRGRVCAAREPRSSLLNRDMITTDMSASVAWRASELNTFAPDYLILHTPPRPHLLNTSLVI